MTTSRKSHDGAGPRKPKDDTEAEFDRTVEEIIHEGGRAAAAKTQAARQPKPPK